MKTPIRRVCGVAMLSFLLAVITAGRGVTAADKDKDNNKQEQVLRKQVNALQQELKQANNQIDNLRRELKEREQTINRLRADDKKGKGTVEMRKDLADARRDLTQALQSIQDKNEVIAVLKKQASKEAAATAKLVEDLQKKARELDALKKTPYLHTVVVKFKKDATAAQIQALLDDIPSLLGRIPSVKGLWYGRRADEASPDFAVKDFDVSLTILFDNYDGLTRYLEHPMHKSFLNKHLKTVENPLVYDALKPIP